MTTILYHVSWQRARGLPYLTPTTIGDHRWLYAGTNYDAVLKSFKAPEGQAVKGAYVTTITLHPSDGWVKNPVGDIACGNEYITRQAIQHHIVKVDYVPFGTPAIHYQERLQGTPQGVRPSFEELGESSARRALQDSIDRMAEKVRRYLTIVTPEDIQQDYVLHISTNTHIREWTPIIGRRQARSEDRTIPRITCAPTLLGSMIGYAKAEHDFLHGVSSGKEEHDKYKGGWKIYAFDFGAALKPDKRLVYDQTSSDELWLTTYSDNTHHYYPRTAGKCFFSQLTHHGRSEQRAAMRMVLYVEVVESRGVRFSDHHRLTPGYWQITGPAPECVASWRDDKLYEVVKIERAAYMEAKFGTANLLSHTAPRPAFLNW